MSKQEEIIEVCGKKVVVGYARTQEEACSSCAFCSRKEWAQILATNPALRAEFDKMCPPQPIRGSIAPEADLEEEIRRYMESDDTNPAEPWDWRDKKGCARHFAEWGAEHLKK